MLTLVVDCPAINLQESAVNDNISLNESLMIFLSYF